MIWQILTFQPESTILFLHIGIDSKSGGKIALLIIILVLILLGVVNWAGRNTSQIKSKFTNNNNLNI